MIDRLISKFRNMLLRSFTVSPQEEGNQVYTIKTQALGQTYLNVVYYPYGYSASPPLNTQCVNMALSCQPESSIALPYNSSDRWKGLKEGECQIGNTKTQSFIKFNEDGTITLKGNLKVEGSVEATENISNSETGLNQIKQTYNSHTHIDSNGNATSGPSSPL